MRSLLLFIIPLFLSGCMPNGILDEGLLRGAWTSLDDPKYSMIFEDDVRSTLYDNIVLSKGGYTVSDAIPKTEYVKEGPYLVVEEEDTFIYAILKLSEEELTLMHLPRGNILRYRR